jgi:DNA polymerase III alpha subunit (gram-positive type)
MIIHAITELKTPKGVSTTPVERFLRANYDLTAVSSAALRSWIRVTIKRGVEDGQLKSDRFHSLSYHVTEDGKKWYRKAIRKEKTAKAAAEAAEEEEKKEKKAKAKKKKEEKEEKEEKGKKGKRAGKKEKKELEEEEEEEEEEEKPKPKPKPKAKAKAKRAPRKKKEEKKEEDKEEAKEAKEAEPKAKPAKKRKAKEPEVAAEAPAAKKRRVKEKKEEKEVPVNPAAPDITATGVAFNTTDIPVVRDDVMAIIKTVLQDDNNLVGVVANRGASADAAYNLEKLDFINEYDKISSFVAGSFGEGSDWLTYYRMVLDTAQHLPWAMCREKLLILVGDNGTQVLQDPSLQSATGKLERLGVKVFGFHHSQLDLLQTILSSLH